MNSCLKKFSVFFLAFILLICTGLTVSAASTNVRVSVNGRHVSFNDDLGIPFINDNDRTMVPFRAVANFMDGVEVQWDDHAKEASFWRKWIPANLGEPFYFTVAARFPIWTNQVWQDIWLYDEEGNLIDSYSRFTQMDTISVIVNSRTYAPIRYLAETLYCDVGWNDKSRTVLINEPEDIAYAFIAAESDEPDRFITWDYTARQYAYIYLRRMYGDFNPNLEYLGEQYEYFEDEQTGWLFNCVEPGELVYIYVNDAGQTWYSNDGNNYNLWY